MSHTKNTATSTPPAPPAPAAVVRGAGVESIRRARQTARAFAGRLTPAPDPATADTLVLVVCELVTNALRHGGGRYTLKLSAGPDTLTAAVSDPCPARPRLRRPSLHDASGGFGWHMVRRLTRDLTVSRGPGAGKTVRAHIPR
jgi:anti-sigma regulatory factor (Ser/Thr protein kinase)